MSSYWLFSGGGYKLILESLASPIHNLPQLIWSSPPQMAMMRTTIVCLINIFSLVKSEDPRDIDRGEQFCESGQRWQPWLSTWSICSSSGGASQPTMDKAAFQKASPIPFHPAAACLSSVQYLSSQCPFCTHLGCLHNSRLTEWVDQNMTNRSLGTLLVRPDGWTPRRTPGRTPGQTPRRTPCFGPLDYKTLWHLGQFGTKDNLAPGQFGTAIIAAQCKRGQFGSTMKRGQFGTAMKRGQFITGQVGVAGTAGIMYFS